MATGTTTAPRASAAIAHPSQDLVDGDDGTDLGGLRDAAQNDLRVDAEALLEFDRVRETVAAHARMATARAAITATHPAWHFEDVVRLQQSTAEARALLETKGDVGLAGMPDIRDALRRATLGGVLNGAELRDVAHAYESTWTVKALVDRNRLLVPSLAEHADDICDLRDVVDLVSGSISQHGDVLDGATPRLGRLRQRMAASYKALIEHLERLMRQQLFKDALQSDVIASRNERQVLEIKSSHRSTIQGIVHGVSSSGHTVFVEPWSAVESGNRWREAKAAADREELSVLRKVSATIAGRADDGSASVDAAASIDIAMARARYAVAEQASPVEALDASAPGTDVSLVNARHPMLGDAAVPITLRMDADIRALVITGPNTGGKTVAMKTLGLLAMMHQSGMQLPCDASSRLPVWSGIYADIGDAQSIDRSLSTFSSHIARVVAITHRVVAAQGGATGGSNALVLLDELGTGTDMHEGAALARAILADLTARGAWTCITTHHRTVADFAATHDRMQNASVEVDAETLMPNYRLVMGAPGRSYALNVAHRLGIDDAVLRHARSLLDPAREAADDYLDRVRDEAQTERELLARLQADASAERAAAHAATTEANALLAKARRERTELVNVAREQLLREAQQIRRELRRTLREAKASRNWTEARRAIDDTIRPVRSEDWLTETSERAGVGGDGVRPLSDASNGAASGQSRGSSSTTAADPNERVTANAAAEKMPRAADASGAPTKSTEREQPGRQDSGNRHHPPDDAATDANSAGTSDGGGQDDDAPPRVGDVVRVSSLGITGEVVAVEQRGEMTVVAGPMRFQTNTRDAEVVSRAAPLASDTPSTAARPEPKMDPIYLPSADLDVRGSRAQTIESMVQQFVDRAFLQGLGEVRIIHGRGTGALREAVRDALSRESQVTGWRNAPDSKGGDAATIATLG